MLFLAIKWAYVLAPLAMALSMQSVEAGLISLAQTIIADIVSPKERPRYQGYIAGVFAASSFAGPVLGGFMAEKLHWSAIFWINLPLGLLALWMTNSLLKKLPRHEKPHRLDFPGAGLMIVATTALLLALSLAGPHYAWTSMPILALIGCSLLFWVLFVVRLNTAPEPLIALEILVHPVVAMAIIAACASMGVFIGLTIYIPIFLEGMYGLTATESGFTLIPLTVGTVIGAASTARIMARIPHSKFQIPNSRFLPPARFLAGAAISVTGGAGVFFFELIVSRLLLSASIRLTTFGGASTSWTTTSRPSIFASMISRRPTW